LFQSKKRLILIVTVLLVTGFLLTSLVSYYVALNELRHQITQKDLPLAVDNIYLDVRAELQRPIFISSQMAGDTFLIDWATEGEIESDRVVRYLAAIQSRYNTLSAYFISDNTKYYYHPSGRLEKMSEHDKEDAWYFRVKKQTSPFEVNIDYDYNNSDLLTIFINYKVLNEQGEFIGVTGVGVEVNSAKQFIDKSSNRFKHDIYFVDKAGNVKLSNSHATLTFKNIHDFHEMKPIVKDVLSGKEGTYQYHYQGQEHFISARYVEDFNWIILVEQTDEISKKELFNALISNLFICLIILLVVISATNITIGRYQNELELLATRDKLTGLYNRHAFDFLINDYISYSKRNGVSFSIILIDIDFFKTFNDEYGHMIGDCILQLVAQTMKANFRESDSICRWGGEEFLILLKDVGIEDALIIAEKNRLAIENAYLEVMGDKLHVTISSGLSSFKQGDDEDSLLARADKALYTSKNNGRNCVSSF
jgi:diguanylate cyclase (GGDEF)-like protein